MSLDFLSNSLSEIFPSSNNLLISSNWTFLLSTSAFCFSISLSILLTSGSELTLASISKLRLSTLSSAFWSVTLSAISCTSLELRMSSPIFFVALNDSAASDWVSSSPSSRASLIAEIILPCLEYFLMVSTLDSTNSFASSSGLVSSLSSVIFCLFALRDEAVRSKSESIPRRFETVLWSTETFPPSILTVPATISR